MAMCKVSVIVPFWNVEGFFSIFLDSVLGQTLYNIEVILVDDHSSDASYAIAREYQKKDSRIILLQNPCHSGSGGMGRQKGMEVAKGEYVIFWDAGDFVDSDTLRQLYECAEKQRADVVTFGYKCFYDDSTLSLCTVEKKGEEISATGRDTLINYYATLDQGKPFCLGILWNKLIRRSLIADYSIVHPSGAVRMQELPFSVACIIHAKKVVYYPYILYYWRLNNPSSITKSRNIPLLLTVYTTILCTIEQINSAGYMTEQIYNSAAVLLWNSILSVLTSAHLYQDSDFIRDYSMAAKQFFMKHDMLFLTPSSSPVINAWKKWLIATEQKNAIKIKITQYYFYFTIFKYRHIPFSFREFFR